MMKNPETDCYSCTNSNCLIKRHCLDVGADKYLAKKKTIMCKKSANIFIEGSPTHSLYFVFSGKIKVMNTGINGREQTLRFAINGEMLGQRGFSKHQYYPVGAVALEDSIMCNFPLDTLQEMLHELPKLTYDFMIFFAEELNNSETKVRKFAQMSVRDKVIDALLYINRKFGQRNNFIDIQLSRKEIADFAGTTEEQVIRIISALKKEKLIKCVGKKVGIPDVELLKMEIDEHHFFLQI